MAASDPSPGLSNSTPCPVPPEQRPLEQYKELQDSLFFAWAQQNIAQPLIQSWLIAMPLTLYLATGSFALRKSWFYSFNYASFCRSGCHEITVW